MIPRPLLIVGFLLLAASLAFTGWAWLQIPDGALVPTHWGLDGQVDGWMKKMPGLLITPGLMLLVTVLFLALARAEPRQNNLLRSREALGIGWIGTLLLMAMAQTAEVFAALGYRVPVTSLMMPAVAVLIIAIGNALPRTRSNFFIGIRTRWTLESDYAWEKTNRWAGRLFVLSGFAGLAGLAVFGSAVGLIVLVAALLGSAVLCATLSYRYWEQDPERHAHDSMPE